MKKIVKRRKNFRINNPVAFGILCAMILIFFAGTVYALAAGVIAPAVRNYQLANATPSPTPTVAPVTATPSVEPTVSPEDATPTPSLAPGETPQPEATAAPEGKLAGRVVGIDPARGYSSKYKGVSTGVYANRLNYSVATLVKERLEALGATVVMGLPDVKSDADDETRAATMNKAETDLVVRLECNSVDSQTTRGAIVWIPDKHELQSDCSKLGEAVLKAYVDATGFSIAKFNGESIRKVDKTFLTQTKAPVCMLIMGYISNSTEDQKLNDAAFQKTMADGVVKGILSYLGIEA